MSNKFKVSSKTTKNMDDRGANRREHLKLSPRLFTEHEVVKFQDGIKVGAAKTDLTYVITVKGVRRFNIMGGYLNGFFVVKSDTEFPSNTLVKDWNVWSYETAEEALSNSVLFHELRNDDDSITIPEKFVFMGIVAVTDDKGVPIISGRHHKYYDLAVDYRKTLPGHEEDTWINLDTFQEFLDSGVLHAFGVPKSYKKVHLKPGYDENDPKLWATKLIISSKELDHHFA